MGGPSTWSDGSSAAGPRRSTCAARWDRRRARCPSPPGAPRSGPVDASRLPKGRTRDPHAVLAHGALGHRRGRGAALGLARDVVLPRPDARGPIGDRAIGPLVARKLGRRVVDTMVDPLIGGIHAGSVDDMSAAATFPPLLAAAQRRGGLMRALRAEVPAPDPDGPPLFWSIEGGMSSLVGRWPQASVARGVDVRLSARPIVWSDRPDGWTVVSAERRFEADGVVLATPAPATAALLRPHDDEVAGLLDAIDYASVVLVTFRVGTDGAARRARWHGVPRPAPRPAPGREPWAVTACTFLDRKWPHLDRDGEVLLRASLGRIDDTRAVGWSDEGSRRAGLGGAGRAHGCRRAAR